MIKVTEAGIPFYQFENLAACQGITHKIFSRNGGCSDAPYASLNVAFGVGDKKAHVLRNRDIVRQSIDGETLVFANQIHGDQVAVLGRDRGQPDGNPASNSLVADAMVTDRPRWYPVIQVADCQSVMLCEPHRRVVANIHCGWRGRIQNLLGRTVRVLVEDFDCDPGRILAGIGPSLGPCCAEFINYETEIPEALWQYKNATHHFDFWSLSAAQLAASGVPAGNVEIGRICTRCRTDEFFSYRAEKITGRFAAVIGLK